MLFKLLNYICSNKLEYHILNNGYYFYYILKNDDIVIVIATKDDIIDSKQWYKIILFNNKNLNEINESLINNLIATKQYFYI